MPKTAPYITIHGPDGAGKTTTGRRISQMLAEQGREAIFFDDWRDETKWKNPFSDSKLRESLEGKKDEFAILQLAKTALDSTVITDLTATGIVVIKDRGVIDVRADLSYRDIDPSVCRCPQIREPDFAIFLRVGEEARRRRLKVKEDLCPEDLQPNTPGHRLYAITRFVEDAVGEIAPDRGIIIPSDYLSVEQVAEIACAAIEERVQL